MKLEKLIIKNFRGLKGEENVIEFTNSNIIFLIGQNNIGKSSILRAYEYFISPTEKAKREDFYNYDTTIPIVIEAIFKKEDEDDENNELIGSGRNQEPDWIDKWVDDNSLIKFRKTWSAINETFLKETFSPQENNWIENGFGGLHQKLTKYAPEPIAINAMEDEATLEEKVNKLLQDDFIKKVKEDYPGEYQDIVDKVKNLQEQIVGSDAVQNYNDELNANFQKVFFDLKLKIEPKEEGTLKIEDAFKKNHSVSVQKENTERKETFLQNGHGVIRQALFNFLAFLKHNSEGISKQYLILFEEPELFLHPKIAFKLRESLYQLAESSPYQVICSTHSPLMIDISKQHSSLVRVAKDNDDTTKTFQVGHNVFQSDSVRKQRVQMINRFNPHICEAFYANKTIVVEGDTETIVYRDLLRRFFPDEEIFVLNTGSKNNIPFFQEVLTAFNIEHYVIHDTDTRTNSNGNTNSAWTLNERIWEKIQYSNSINSGLARRYVHITNFETAHAIDLNGKDKPFKAFEFVSSLNDDSNVDCLNWLKDIINNNNIIHDQDYIEENT